MNPAPVGLERRLGPGAAGALVVGEIIGIGIFLTPAEMAKALGSPFWVLVVWLAVGAAALCGALCYGELAARHPALAAVMALFMLSLLSKASGAPLPITLLILDVYPWRRLGGARGWTGAEARRVYLEKVPFLLLSAMAGIASIHTSPTMPP